MITEGTFIDKIADCYDMDGLCGAPCYGCCDTEKAGKECYELAKQLSFEFHKYFISFYDKAMKGEDIRDFEIASLEQRWEMFELYLKSKEI